MSTTSYVRDESYRYVLQSHPGYYFEVGRSADQQALWGILNGEAWLLRFTLDGELTSTERLESSALHDTTAKPDHRRILAGVSSHLRQQLGWVDEPISVKRFRLRQGDAGIDDLSEVLREFLENPSEYESDDRIEMQASADEWLSSGMFVFWWGQDYDVAESGLVSSS